jgi:hypothetical protein
MLSTFFIPETAQIIEDIGDDQDNFLLSWNYRAREIIKLQYNQKNTQDVSIQCNQNSK